MQHPLGSVNAGQGEARVANTFRKLSGSAAHVEQMGAALKRGKQQMLNDRKCFAMVLCTPAPVVGRCERVEFLIPFNWVAFDQL